MYVTKAVSRIRVLTGEILLLYILAPHCFLFICQVVTFICRKRSFSQPVSAHLMAAKLLCGAFSLRITVS